MSVSTRVAVPLAELLLRHGLVDDPSTVQLEPLDGGVSSEIWLVRTPERKLVVKRPLAQLRVASEWRAPLRRSRSEAGWLEVAGALVPGICPQVLAYDDDEHFLALSYLDPADHLLWKGELMAGRVDRSVAAAVGDRLGGLHAGTSRRPELAEQFATDELFVALRIEPYLLRLGERHPAIAPAVRGLAASLLETKLALVHGDASPKNILVGPQGPVLLDAETAWWGDPAFDVAFCLNHLMLKALRYGAPVRDLLDAADALLAAYTVHVDWEPSGELEHRVAALLPALMLARVDGRSPVEYLRDDARETVRRFALPLVGAPVELPALFSSWKDLLS
ncbi:MAG TPA: phosphotransferase [Nocardioidaceae bacterium]|nr:phosphotransferase [Nocardioidaceae bacterium]